MSQRVVLDIHLPLSADMLDRITRAVQAGFPNAVIGDSGQPDVLRILSEPEPGQQVIGGAS